MLHRISVLSSAVLMAFAVACAPAADDEQASVEQRQTGGSGAGVAACAGRKACVDAFVLRTLLASDLTVTDETGEENGGRPVLAAELVMRELRSASPEDYDIDGWASVGLGITTDPADDGDLTVIVVLETLYVAPEVIPADGSAGSWTPDVAESAKLFSFTLRGSSIVERNVPLIQE